MNVQDRNYAARLRLACYCGRLDIVQELLNHGANPKSENFQGENPLHLLSQGEHDSHEDNVRIAQELLARAVHVDARSKCHRTPLHLASYFGRPAIVQVLLDFGAKPDATDSYGETPLHLLSRGKCYSQDDRIGVARLLLNFGANVNAPDVENRTPLHHASYNGVVAIAQLLLEHGGKPNATDRNGETPLHLALKCKDDSEEHGIGITLLLLEHGADVGAQDNCHVTPFDLSSRLWRPKIANTLLEHGANVFFIV
jgi:ankyrin repeat protein